MVPSFSRAGAVGVVLVAALAHGSAGADMAQPERWFKEAVTARDLAYVKARERLLSSEEQAAELLKKQIEVNENDEARWLAEILLARLQHSREFDRLEKVFDEKVRLIKFDYPSRTIIPGLRSIDFSEGLRLSDEDVPTTSGSGKPLKADLQAHYEATRIPPSQQWEPFLGEIVLKGWLPTVVEPVAAWTPPPPGTPITEWGIPFEGANKPPALTTDDYVQQAILLLGKLGDHRAAARIVTILEDEKQGVRKRALCARALGLMNSERALDTLLRLAEDNHTVPLVRLDVFHALAKMKNPKAAPVLERIAAWEDIRAPGDLGPGRWKREARLALEQIRNKKP